MPGEGLAHSALSKYLVSSPSSHLAAPFLQLNPRRLLQPFSEQHGCHSHAGHRDRQLKERRDPAKGFMFKKIITTTSRGKFIKCDKRLNSKINSDRNSYSWKVAGVLL